MPQAGEPRAVPGFETGHYRAPETLGSGRQRADTSTERAPPVRARPGSPRNVIGPAVAVRPAEKRPKVASPGIGLYRGLFLLNHVGRTTFVRIIRRANRPCVSRPAHGSLS